MTDTEKVRPFPALRLLENRAMPTLHGHMAYYRAPVPAPAQSHVLIPSWTWTGIRAEDYPADETVNLDVNGSYMAALGGVDIAFTDLKRMGPMDALTVEPREVLPGYYRIVCPRWVLDAEIVHPLGGDAHRFVGKPLWIAHPTLILLLELHKQQAIEYFDIVDSWVSGQRCNFRDWNRLLKQTREALMDAIDTEHPDGAPQGCKCQSCARYTAFKEGYGMAFSMMRTGQGCKVRRPDWADAVYAQHAAARWRNAWRFSSIGPLLFMGSTDELTVRREDLATALGKTSPPLKLDESGRLLGHYKVKARQPEPEQQDERQGVTVTSSAPWSSPFGDESIL